MELRHLRYFVMAAEEANISRAAARLNVSQPAVSRQIHDLEDELGVALFSREYNGLKLTTAGETALAHARELLRQSGALVEAMRGFGRKGKTASLKVGFIPSALPGLLAEGLKIFNRTHPKVCVQIYEMNPSEQEKALASGEIDLALLGAASPAIKRHYQTRPIRHAMMAAIVPHEHPLASRSVIDLAELAHDTFISLHEKHFPSRPQIMTRLFERAGIQPEVAVHAAGLTELLGLVSAGVGVAIVPDDLIRLAHPGVNFLKLKRPTLKLSSSAVWRKEATVIPITELIDLLEIAGQKRETS
jgi:DNA-binding transcriptional LysR family regulator